MSKYVLLLAVFSIIINVSDVIATPTPKQTQESNYTTQNLCLSPGCIHTASRLLTSMDLTVDPCEDFYQFACGNFIKNTVIPDDNSRVISFELVYDNLQKQVRKMMEEPVLENEPKAFKMMKKYYGACMNTSLVEENFLKTIQDFLRELGGWPVLEGNDWNEEEFEWIEQVNKSRKFGLQLGNFIDLVVDKDLRNSTRNIIHMRLPRLGLPDRFDYMSSQILEAYFKYMVDVAVYFGADVHLALKELKQSLDFETELAKILIPSKQTHSNLHDLETKFPSIPLRKYFNIILAPTTLMDNETIELHCLQYLSDFEVLIRKTSKRVQANYFIWMGLKGLLTHLTESMRIRQFEFSRIFSGQTAIEARWKTCARLSSDNFFVAAGALYIRKYFNEQTKANVAEMVSNIRSEFEETLKNVDWMDEETRNNALDKARAMSTDIAYPDELLDDKIIDEFYGDLELDETNYVRSLTNVLFFLTNTHYKQLRQTVNATSWVSRSRLIMVNAYYLRLKNRMVFPAGILQDVFFDVDRPQYMNYGSIGFLIGREIIHGFDYHGQHFDKYGNVFDWWAPQTKMAFLKKAVCMIEKYENYTVPELNTTLDGIRTLNENVADNEGITQAYLAYNKWIDKNGEETLLPGLNYTGRQLFWVSSAHIFCLKSRKEDFEYVVRTDLRSPERYRILIALSNSEHFARDFNCPLESNMNPKHKCHVW